MNYIINRNLSYQAQLLLGALIVAVAGVVYYVIQSVLGNDGLWSYVPFITFYPAIFVISVLACFSVSSLSVLACAVIAAYLFIEPVNSFEISSLDGRAALGLFVVLGLAVSYIAKKYKNINEKLANDREEARQSAMDSERLYRGIGESINYGIWTSDKQGGMEYFSQSFCDLTGRKVDELMRDKWLGVIHPEDREGTWESWLDSVVESETWYREHRILDKDGEVRHVLSRGVPILDEKGDVKCWAGNNLDIQQLKAYEKLVHESSQRKDQFIAFLAHELRNPLATVSNGIELVLQDEGSSKERFSDINNEIQTLVRLIDDLLDISRIDQNKYELRLQTINLKCFIDDVVASNAHFFSHKQLEVEVSHSAYDEFVRADPIRIKQVIDNILSNAVKFSPTGGEIKIKLSSIDGHSVVEVTDSGQGISADFIGKVFDMYAQDGISQSSKRGSLGVGMALSKKVVEMHGGHVSVSSNGLSKGAAFKVSLPKCDYVQSDINQSGTERTMQLNSDMRVLIVDDNEPLAEMIEEYLVKHQKQTVKTVYSGAEALDCIAEFEPGVVILDISLPDIDGFEVADRIRKSERGNDIYIVAMSGFNRSTLGDKLERLSIDEFLIKPARLSSLVEVLSKAPVNA